MSGPPLSDAFSLSDQFSGAGKMIDDFRAQWDSDRRFGLVCTATLPPMDRRVADAACKAVFDYYWSGFGPSADLAVCKRLAADSLAAIEVAVAEHDAINQRPGKKERLRSALRERDGDDCWICGHELHDDCTIEHKVALANGGTWAFANLALAHRECNRAVARLPLELKQSMREMNDDG